MRLEEGLWLEGAYYIDRNQAGEIRIVGPNNHLYYGSTGLRHHQITILDVKPLGGEIQLHLHIVPDRNHLPDPTMGHIRRVRSYTQILGHQEPTFAEIQRRHPGELTPTRITTKHNPDNTQITYLRTYGEQYYGVHFMCPPGLQLRRDDNHHGYYIQRTTSDPIDITIITTTNALPEPYRGPLFSHHPYHLHRLPSLERTFASHLLDRTAAEIDHLVANGKTSGFDYGTLFPRDWIETADLIADELTPSALRYIYTAALQHVNNAGAGWHEDIVGEFKYEREQERQHLSQNIDALLDHNQPLRHQLQTFLGLLDDLFIARHMIDIEPHYLLGLRLIPPAQFDPASLQRLRRVAAFVISQADTRDLITFNKLAAPFRRQRGDEYYDAGNWRDSTLAFRQIHPVLAPFDVNAVFYPQALRIIRHHHEALQADPTHLDRLITKWDRVRDWYRFTSPDGTPAFALALYNIRSYADQLTYDLLPVNHLDEAFDLFYGTPSEAEVASFATRLLSPRYFYTPSGPILVGHDQGYDHTQYHGEVIWAKQAAYTIAGLERCLQRGQIAGWSAATQDLIRTSLLTTAETTLQAFRQLGAIPELHYDDHGRARLYDDQPHPEGQMNKVQLWSAAAARRILATYLRHIPTSRPLFHPAPTYENLVGGKKGAPT